MENFNYEPLTYDDPSLPIIFHLDFLEKKQSILAHWHENIEILYVIEGNITVFTEDGQENVNPDEAVIINSGCLHKIITDKKGVYHCLIVDKKMCEEFSLYIGEIHFESAVKDKKMSKLFKKITKELTNKKLYYKAAVKSAIIDLMVYLSRNYVKSNMPIAEYPPNIRVQTVKNAVKYIQDNYNKSISTAEISQVLGLSNAYLCRLFKELTGCTAIYYINLLRCQKARMLIQAGDCTVSEAASSCGFENLSYFTKTYKKYIGYVPSKTKG